MTNVRISYIIYCPWKDEIQSQPWSNFNSKLKDIRNTARYLLPVCRLKLWNNYKNKSNPNKVRKKKNTQRGPSYPKNFTVHMKWRIWNKIFMIYSTTLLEDTYSDTWNSVASLNRERSYEKCILIIYKWGRELPLNKQEKIFR